MFGSLLSPFVRVGNKVILNQSAFFSKYISKSRAKHLPLTTKRAGKGGYFLIIRCQPSLTVTLLPTGFYKGNGCRTEGFNTSKGHFIVDQSKRTELVVPDLTGFKVLSVLNKLILL